MLPNPNIIRTAIGKILDAFTDVAEVGLLRSRIKDVKQLQLAM